MSQNSQIHKCPKCNNNLKLIQKNIIRDREYHLYRCSNCNRLFIEDNLENEKEIFDSFLKNQEYLEEKYNYFIAYLINKGRFIYAKEYVEQYKSKFNVDARLLMNEFLIELRCKNEKDLQFYIKNMKDLSLLKEIIFSLDNEKREKITKFFMVSLTNCATIFGGNDLLKCDQIFENILGLYTDIIPFNKEIKGFAQACKNKNFNDVAKKYYELLDENNKDSTSNQNNRSKQKYQKIKKKQGNFQEKTQKNKVKTQKTFKTASEKKKIEKIIIGSFSVIFIIVLIIVGAFYFKGDFK